MAAGVRAGVWCPGMGVGGLFGMQAGCNHRGVRPVARLRYILKLILVGVDLAPGAEVGPGRALPHPVGVAIAPACRLGRNVRLFQQVSVGGGSYEVRENDGFPTVGDRCWIFAGAKVLGPVDIGDDAMVAANALGIRSVPARRGVVGSRAGVGWGRAFKLRISGGGRVEASPGRSARWRKGATACS